jgi:hypothetical protein
MCLQSSVTRRHLALLWRHNNTSWRPLAVSSEHEKKMSSVILLVTRDSGGGKALPASSLCVLWLSSSLSLARPYNIALGQSMLPPLMRAVTLICALLSLSLAGPKSFYAGRPLSGWKFFISLCTAGCCPASARACVYVRWNKGEAVFGMCLLFFGLSRRRATMRATWAVEWVASGSRGTARTFTTQLAGELDVHHVMVFFALFHVELLSP